MTKAASLNRIDASRPVVETRIPPLTFWRRGKVRDVYDLGDRLLIVATDRISAFDVVLPTGIPAKGIVLTQLSLFWFRLLADVLPNHVVTANVAEYGPELAPFRDQLEGRSMIVIKTEPLPVECVVRGYIAGSGWKDYRATGAVCGISLPPGLQESQRLEPALFTPSTKAETGHDENISFARVEQTLGRERAAEVRDVSLEIYRRAHAHAEERGIILADTKFEFGVRDGRLIWIDEALTPTRPASGRATDTRQGAASRASTSSTCVTIWRPWPGTNGRRVPRCRPRWRSGPATSISRRTPGSPARIFP